MDIKAIQTYELEKDLKDSLNDISCCSIALSTGITEYSGGSVQKRLDTNKEIVKKIQIELDIRKV